MVFLSFNPFVTAPEDLADDEEDNEDSSIPDVLPLRQTWVVWQQFMASGAKKLPYGASTRQIATVTTVEEFWRTWDLLPQPSELFAKRMVHTADHGIGVDAIMVFRDGVLPQWEDAANADGGHFQFQFKTSVGGAQLDEYWNNIVLASVGGVLEPSDMITGLRLVDKLAAGKSGGMRMEVWFDSIADQKAVATLQRNVERCLATKPLEGKIGAPPKAEMKHHRMTRHQ
eukprot:TRINITY_DN50573_c0_g1_i1.p1 TRINITY_DN50573_c0_g1~~TRINITY_DN50573_c0_g1_i1.p1  ORF type:complete len:228 (-),score=57.88 TRINITY_DN50573_c0_g1_i1:32-715(-)